MKNFEKYLIIGAIIALVVIGGIWYYFERVSVSEVVNPTIISSCISSGGTITTGLCCGIGSFSTQENFPNTCLIGACGCAPTASHKVQSCDCGNNKCWNGESCVLFNECNGMSNLDCVCPTDAVKTSVQTMCEIPPCPMSYSCRYSECKVNDDCQSGLCSGNGKCQ